MARSDHTNITLSLPRELLIRLKHLAVDNGTSVSLYVRELVEGALADEDCYRRAARRQVELMNRGLPMGLDAWVPGARDELHER